MDAFTVSQMLQGHDWSRVQYNEFVRRDSMSLGLYMLPRGSTDRQQPHKEDEVYYVVSGRARISVGSEERTVEPGSIIFVAAGVEHRFHSIDEDLTSLVFFAPAETTPAPPKAKG